MSSFIMEVHVEEKGVVASVTTHEAAEAAARLLRGDGYVLIRYAPRLGREPRCCSTGCTEPATNTQWSHCRKHEHEVF